MVFVETKPGVRRDEEPYSCTVTIPGSSLAPVSAKNTVLLAGRTGLEDAAEVPTAHESTAIVLADTSTTGADLMPNPAESRSPLTTQDSSLEARERPANEGSVIESLCSSVVALYTLGKRDDARKLAELLADLLGATSAEREPVKLATVTALRLKS